MEAAQRLECEVMVGLEEAHIFSEMNPGAHIQLDFGDPEGSTERIVEISKEFPIDSVISVEDEGLELAAMAGAALGLDYNDISSVSTASNKYAMRKILSEAGLKSPNYWLINIEEDSIVAAYGVEYPCVLKPLFLSASRGVVRANNEKEFSQAFELNKKILEGTSVKQRGGKLSESILVESYIPGDEVALEGILNDEELIALAVFDKPDKLEGPYFEETIYVTPSRKAPEVIQKCWAEVEAAVNALKLKAGPIHVELRITEGEPWVVDIAPRSIGGYCSKALEFEGGIMLEEIILRQSLGMDIAEISREEQASGVMMIPIPKSGTLMGIKGLADAREVDNIENIIISITPGQTLLAAPNGSRYLGFIFSRAETPGEVEESVRIAHSKLNFDIQPLNSKV